MKIGSMKEVLLSSARDAYLFDCQVVGLDLQTITGYRNVLAAFIRFTGNILVKDLTPDHVRIYIDNLSDGPAEGEEHRLMVFNHYTVIHEWIRWLCAQKFLAERSDDVVKPPRSLTRRLDILMDKDLSAGVLYSTIESGSWPTTFDHVNAVWSQHKNGI